MLQPKERERRAPGDFDPLIIVGTGRCGSTLLHRILARHRRLAWFSQLCERYPGQPELNRLAMGLLDTPGAGDLLRRYLDPVEAYELWESLAPGFAQPDHDLDRADLRNGDRKRIRHTLDRMLTRKRNRLLLKITGWPRIGYLDAVFDDPHFVHIFRDGRAVAASLLTVPWWKGRKGPEQWRWGPLKPALEKRWAEHDRSVATLAGIQWELLMDTTESAAGSVPAHRYTRVRYEDLCDDPMGELRRITAEAGLRWSSEMGEAVRSMSIRNRNPRWKDRVAAPERKRLESALAPALSRYGYA